MNDVSNLSKFTLFSMFPDTGLHAIAEYSSLSGRNQFDIWNEDIQRTGLTLRLADIPVAFNISNSFHSPGHCINTFDFSICQAIAWYEYDGEFRSICSPNYYRDLESMRLRYTNPRRTVEYPELSVFRIPKFLHRGYSMTDADKKAFCNKRGIGLGILEAVINDYK